MTVAYATQLGYFCGCCAASANYSCFKLLVNTAICNEYYNGTIHQLFSRTKTDAIMLHYYSLHMTLQSHNFHYLHFCKM